MEETVKAKRPALPARPESSLSQSAAVSYLTKISKLELLNSELEVQAQVARAESVKLREQLKIAKEKVARLNGDEEELLTLREKVQRLSGENDALRTELVEARAEIELLSRNAEGVGAVHKQLKNAKSELFALRSSVRAQIEEETATLRAENDLLKLELRMTDRPRSTNSHCAHSKVVNVRVDSDSSQKSLSDAQDEILVKTVSLAEMHEQPSPSEPRRAKGGTARKGRVMDKNAEALRDLSAYRKAMTRGGSAPRLSALAKYTPSSVRTVRKSKNEDSVSHVHMPRVSEIKLAQYLTTRTESFTTELPAGLQ